MTNINQGCLQRCTKLNAILKSKGYHQIVHNIKNAVNNDTCSSKILTVHLETIRVMSLCF